ncbi:MAG: dihydroorotate dehydrogenase electron transfer subunit [Candidatus Methylomirabilota bacterium]
MRATLSFLRPLSPAYRHLGIAVPGFPDEVSAGRFIMLRPPWVGDPYLPRAFSIYRRSQTADGTPVVEILLKLVGKGTRLLAELSPGQPLELLGPLGNAFTPPPAGATAVLVAGGVGVPPLAAFAAQIRNPKSEIRHCAVFLGGKTAEDILCVDDFRALGIEPHITTEDGSLGTRGLITDLLGPYLIGPPLTTHHSPLTAYTCGPPGMLAAVARLAETHALPCQVSVEANMACGFGACMGCAIEMRSAGPGRRYSLVCQDGPIFDAREIAWDRTGRAPGAEHRAGRGCGCHES